MKTTKKKTDESPVSSEEKRAALAAALGKIEKDFGKGTIMRLGANAKMNVEAIPTGSLTLDLALGIGGVPRGRIVEIYGPESSGKTTVALHIVSEVQKKGGTAAFIDAEHALDPVYAKALGVNIDDLLISQPDSGEQALDVTEMLVRSGAIDVVVVDSVAALVPQAEIDDVMGANQVGTHARMMSKAMRKLSGVISKTNCVAIFINQLRKKIGVMYGNPETTTGGEALKFYASVRLDVRKTESLKKGTDVYGNMVKVKVVKNKVAPPFKVAEFEIIYGKGISKAGEILELGQSLDLIKKSGSFFYYNGEKIAQGKDAAREYLEKNPAVAEDIEAKIRAQAEKVEIVPEETYSLEEDGEDPAGDNVKLDDDDFDIRVLSVDADE
ncbi:MAG: recombinase RecA [Clostridia bacterium]|nr:recombinase RecA [Clostridia bacterium]